jgi:hypothetical protein
MPPKRDVLKHCRQLFPGLRWRCLKDADHQLYLRGNSPRFTLDLDIKPEGACTWGSLDGRSCARSKNEQGISYTEALQRSLDWLLDFRTQLQRLTENDEGARRLTL